MELRKVRFPIKLKIISMITIIMGSAISFYVYIALDLFKEDKSAYIFENSRAFVENLSDQVGMYFQDLKVRQNILVNSYFLNSEKGSLQKLLDANEDIYDFSIYKIKDQMTLKVYSICNELMTKKETEGICNKSLSKNLQVQRSSFEKLSIESIKDNKKIYFIISSYHKESSSFYIFRVKMDRILRIIDASKRYQSQILERTGKIFWGNGDSKKGFEFILNSKLNQGVREIIDESGVKKLLAYSKIKPFEFYVISGIPYEKAFQAATYLINKSFYFALLVLSVAIIIGIFFSRSITSHIQQLVNGTQLIAKGDFESKVIVASNDEVGVLADSFNYMSNEIIKYMAHMKEKLRLENEVAVAKLVQSCFFPEPEINKNGLSIAAFYTPASECGGDFWGYIDHAGKSILILADATGHGIPAALLTATIHSCVSSLKNISKGNQEILNSPAKILKFMNHAVCSVGSQVMLTCFVCIIDPIAKTIKYSNASHNPPFLCKNSLKKEASKSDLFPLMGAIGPRLGHIEEGEYLEEEDRIEKGDVLILYTDGLTECTNPEGKQWGKRRFMGSLLENLANTDAMDLRDKVMSDAFQFYSGQDYEDDVTLIVGKVI